MIFLCTYNIEKSVSLMIKLIHILLKFIIFIFTLVLPICCYILKNMNCNKNHIKAIIFFHYVDNLSETHRFYEVLILRNLFI